MKTAGFCLCVDKSKKADSRARCDSLQACEVNVAFENHACTIFSNNAASGTFVNLAESNGWVIGAIGSTYLGGPAAKELASTLETHKETSPEQLVNSVQSMFGQFCLVAYDIRSHSLVVVSDPSGVRSLFFHENESSIYISSNISLLRKVTLSETPTADIENQAFLLRYGFNLPTHTPLENFTEIPPKLLKLISLRNLKHEQSFPAAKPSSINEDYTSLAILERKVFESDYEKELLRYLFGACKQQLGSAEKVGVLLGGFDSALVASLLKHVGAEVETYSFHYENARYNQPYADELATTLGIKHHWVRITPHIIEEGIRDFGETSNWPVLWLNYVIQTQHLCRLMAENGAQACFSGDGCDTVFLGYPSTHRRGALYKRLPKLSPAIATGMKKLVHASRIENIVGHIARVGLSLIDASQFPPDERAPRSFQLFDDLNYQKLTRQIPGNYPSHDRHFENFVNDTRELNYERKIYLAKSFISPNRCKIVSSSDASSIPIHSPYMHPAVAHFARTLPVELLRPSDEDEASREGKFLLMKAAKNADLLPEEIIYQRKLAAIASPIDEWLSGPLKEFAMSHLERLPFDADKRYLANLLSEKSAEKLYKNNFAGDGVVGIAASLLLTYASFFE